MGVLGLFMLAMYVEAPPPQFDHAYRGAMHIHVVNSLTVGFRCGRDGLMACAVRPCEIWVDEKYRAQLAELIRHERAHCNGWRH